MKVRILKTWIAAGNAKPGDIVEVDDQFIEHGMATGLCEDVNAQPVEEESAEESTDKEQVGEPVEEEVVKVADTPETPKKRTYRK